MPVRTRLSSRPGRRDLELLARRAHLAAHVGEATEDPEVDAVDLDAEATRRDQRVAELVQRDRCREAERRDRGDGEQRRAAGVGEPASGSVE